MKEHNFYKRIIASAIGTTMILTSSVYALAAFPDVDENSYYNEAVEHTTSLGFFMGDHNGNFNPDSPITRAEFTVLMCRLLETEDLAHQLSTDVFSDLTVEHWANGYVSAAMTSGIVSGFDDGTFRPSDSVTHDQAVKMVICALGLQKSAESIGPYPAGYNALAKSKGLISKVESGELLRRDAAMLIYNAVKIIEDEEPESETSKPVNGSGSSNNKPSKPSVEGEAEKPPVDSETDESEKDETLPDEEIGSDEESEEEVTNEKIPFGEGLNLKQEESDTCTASALTMLLRRLYYTNGIDYSHITEEALKNNNKVWLPGVGLYYNIEFEGFKISKRFFDEETDKVVWFEEALKKHPEGIIIYDINKVHAIILTDYRDGIFYASDPATGKYSALEKVTTISGETAEEKLQGIDCIWILEK